MLSILKKWFWYDWVILAIRTVWLAIIVISDFVNPSLIIVPLWIVLSLLSWFMSFRQSFTIGKEAGI